ncbi:YjdF family protein [uncultured Prevotella sp.]|uniref:YjdF family protein n=1 Tax=uncultured Prevotella sp. TaxID=159272 RepID=UPI002584805E|nr:YjdF family protein [uncultured Prevotella sp.]
MNTGTLTVLFEDPFWIGLFEKTDNEGLHVCKVTFGAEPTDKEVMAFIDKNWHLLQFSQAVEAERDSGTKINPKRQLREAKKQMQSQGIGTKSQQALKLQQEQNKMERKQRSKAEREAEKQRQFDLRQAKRKEKQRGH